LHGLHDEIHDFWFDGLGLPGLRGPIILVGVHFVQALRIAAGEFADQVLPALSESLRLRACRVFADSRFHIGE
jgi:hypothetical protein